MRMTNCNCEYEEEVNPIQSGVRIHKLITKCKECEERDKQNTRNGRIVQIKQLTEKLHELEAGLIGAKQLGYTGMEERNQAGIDAIKKQLEELERDAEPEAEKAPLEDIITPGNQPGELAKEKKPRKKKKE